VCVFDVSQVRRHHEIQREEDCGSAVVGKVVREEDYYQTV